ncbi:hypothetical protein [Sicyoidochytrium minutum DNA virus]|nr:hypothetical protein [Sicyoidochytrium minutum DNA virus]
MADTLDVIYSVVIVENFSSESIAAICTDDQKAREAAEKVFMNKAIMRKGMEIRVYATPTNTVLYPFQLTGAPNPKLISKTVCK